MIAGVVSSIEEVVLKCGRVELGRYGQMYGLRDMRCRLVHNSDAGGSKGRPTSGVFEEPRLDGASKWAFWSSMFCEKLPNKAVEI